MFSAYIMPEKHSMSFVIIIIGVVYSPIPNSTFTEHFESSNVSVFSCVGVEHRMRAFRSLPPQDGSLGTLSTLHTGSPSVTERYPSNHC